MVAVERSLHEEAAIRLGRELTEGEKAIDLAANDAILEDAKQALYEEIEKEKRRSIRKFLAGEKHELRITPAMVGILVRLRLAGIDAAEGEWERLTRTRETRALALYAPDYRWEYRPITDNVGGWEVFDKELNIVVKRFPAGHLADAAAYIRGLIEDAKAAAVAAVHTSAAVNATKSLTAEIEARFPGWVWDTKAQIFVPKAEPLRTVYRALYDPSGWPTSLSEEERIRQLLSAGYEDKWVNEAAWAHDLGLSPSLQHGARFGTGLPRPGASWEAKALAKAGANPEWVVDWDEGLQKFVARDALGHPAILSHVDKGIPPMPRVWDERSRAERWVAKQSAVSPAQVRAAVESGKAQWAGTPNEWNLAHMYDKSGHTIQEDWKIVDRGGNTIKVFRQQPGDTFNGAWYRADDYLGKLQVGEIQPPPNIRTPGLRGGSTIGAGDPTLRAHPWIPSTEEVLKQRAELISQGILRGALPRDPAQMLLFDPQLEPLMNAFNMQLKGITKRINKEGMAQLEINQDAAVSALAKAIDAKVPGALDAAGRMVSGPFNAGLGDVYLRKGGLFQKWQYSAIADPASCEVCMYFDGTIYYSWRAIAELHTSPLPNGGPNPGCFGDQRCRCRPVPYFGDVKIGDKVQGAGEVHAPAPASGTGTTPDEDLLSSTPLDGFTNIQSLGGGVSDTYHGYLPNGTHVKIVPFEGTRKIYAEIPEFSDGNNEQANWQIAKRYFMGPDIHVNVPAHIVADIPDLGGLCDVSIMVPGYTESNQYPSDDEIPGWALFDSIVGQHDHHGGNASLAENGDGKFWLIDNGLSFPSYNQDSYYGHTKPWDAYLSYNGDYSLSDAMRGKLETMKADRTSLDAELSRYLDSDQLDSMWERIDTMLDSGSLVDGNGGVLSY